MKEWDKTVAPRRSTPSAAESTVHLANECTQCARLGQAYICAIADTLNVLFGPSTGCKTTEKRLSAHVATPYDVMTR
jgi:hypothetical protein